MVFFSVLLLLSFLILFILIKSKPILIRKKYSNKKEKNKCESPIEEQLMEGLIEKGHEVFCQEQCGIYRIDLTLHNRNRKIAIECDGEAYHSSEEQLAHDRKKDAFLKKNNWIVLRFSGSEIYRDRERCIQMVEKNLMTKKDRKKFRKRRTF